MHYKFPIPLFVSHFLRPADCDKAGVRFEGRTARCTNVIRLKHLALHSELVSGNEYEDKMIKK